MHDLTSFQRDVLYIVAGLTAPNGLGIKDDLDDYYATDINHGRLYPNLDTLVEKGLIKKGGRTTGQTSTHSRAAANGN